MKQPTAASYEQEFYRIKEEYDLKGNLRLTGKKQSTILCEFMITSDKQFFDRLGKALREFLEKRKNKAL